MAHPTQVERYRRARWQWPTALLLFLALSVGAFISPASAARSSAPDSLQAATARGLVDADVVRALHEDGHVDALVNVGGTQALTDAQSAETPLTSETVPAYADLKSDLSDDGTIVQDYAALPTSLVRFDSEADLLAAAQDPAVVSIQPDGKETIDLAQSLPLVHQPEAAAAGYKGANTSVAILDTGVDYTKAAFGSCSAAGGSCKVAVAKDFAPEDGARDVGGHGTNVAAIALGVAPSTKILSLDVVDGNYAWDSDIIAAINWSILNKSTYGITAVNMSLGDTTHHTTECSSSSFTAPFANLRAAGIVPVVSAGNYAYDQGHFQDGISGPACAPGAVSVGAVYDANVGSSDFIDCKDNKTHADDVACFSQDAPVLSVWAPGAMITAAGITYSGTSQAAPHVAGAVAVAGSANPAASPAEIADAIENSGPTINDSRDGVSKHRLDVEAMAAALVTGTPSPAPSPDPSPSVDPSPTPDPSPSPDPEAVEVTGTLTHYHGMRGGYFLIGSRHDAKYKATVAPVPTSEQMSFELERRGADGTWTPVNGSSAVMGPTGGATLAIHARDLHVRARYRVQALFAGDASHLPASSDFSFFRLRRR